MIQLKKRIILIILLAAIFSSCTQIKKDSSENAPVDNDGNVSTIKIAMIGIDPLSQNEDSTSAAIHQKIVDDFGIDIVPISLDEDTWKDQLDEMIANNDLPDVFYHDIMDDTLQYKQLIDLGLIRDIPKSMWTKKDNLSKVMSWYEGTYAKDSKMYFVPRTYQTYDQTHGSSYAIIYRRDWANLVESVPPDAPHFYEITDMIKQFVAKDPNANDIKDTWGITGGEDIDFINYTFLQPFGVREWMYEDGKWIPGLLSDTAKEAIAWVSQLYKEGVIDPRFVHQTHEEALNRFITGKAGACLASIYPQQLYELEEKWNLYNTTSISQSIDIIPLFVAPDGYHYNEVETFSTGTLFSSKLSDKDMEKVLDLMDWMYTEEGRSYFEYGVLDVDYILFSDMPTPIGSDEEVKLSFGEKNIELKGLENLVSWNLDFSSFYVNRMTPFQKYGTDILENNIWAYSYEDELFTNGMLTPEMCVVNIETVAKDLLFDVIMISSDFDVAWNEYVSYCYETFNIDEAAQEVTDRAIEIGITS